MEGKQQQPKYGGGLSPPPSHPKNEKTFYKRVLIKKDEFTKKNIVVNYGIVESPIEMFVEKVFPHENSVADRNLSDMQSYANSHFPKEGYIFKYKEIKIDFSDLEE